MSSQNISSFNSSSPDGSSKQPLDNVSTQPQQKGFSLTRPSTWVSSFSGIFKDEPCEQKRDKTIKKANADFDTCDSKRRGAKTSASSGSMLSFFGFGSSATVAPVAPAKGGGRKKTQKKQKKQRKPKNTNKKRTK